MKRYGNLFHQVTEFENLLIAAKQAGSGKKDRMQVAAFLFHLETELFTLQEELENGSWQPGHYRTFEIREPKLRKISAADFRDRVLHHAICNIIEPILDRRMIYDNWACRTGKGSHGAVARAQKFSRQNRYFLKFDIRRYFDSVDHTILKRLLRRNFKDRRFLALLDKIIDHAPVGTVLGKGLPIGNLTSQHFANLYLSKLDHELKDRLGVKAYLRYMDDMLIFADSKTQLHELLAHSEAFLDDRLSLVLKPSATLIAPVSEGVPFLGFRIFPGLVRLNKKSLSRFKKRLKAAEQDYHNGKIDVETLAASVQAMIAHMSHADTHKLRQSLLRSRLNLG